MGSRKAGMPGMAAGLLLLAPEPLLVLVLIAMAGDDAVVAREQFRRHCPGRPRSR